MCRIMEDLKVEEKIQTALRMLSKNKYSFEEIAEISNLPLETIQELADSINQDSV